MSKTYIFGHKSPDTDSITSSLVMADLETKLGNDVVACRLGSLNKETEYVLNYFDIEAPELIERIEDDAEVILVDHNSPSESIDNIENAKILKVVDHHKIAFETSYPLFVRTEPVGCTETVLLKLYKENGLTPDKTIASLMLSAIISDTLLLKSPTTTEDDKEAVKELAEIAEIDYEAYGLEMLKAGRISIMEDVDAIQRDGVIDLANNINNFDINDASTVTDITEALKNLEDNSLASDTLKEITGVDVDLKDLNIEEEATLIEDVYQEYTNTLNKDEFVPSEETIQKIEESELASKILEMLGIYSK